MPNTNEEIFERLIDLAEDYNYPELHLTLEDGRELEVTVVAISEADRYESKYSTGQLYLTIEFTAEQAEEADLHSNIGNLAMKKPGKNQYHDLEFYMKGADESDGETLIGSVESVEVLSEDFSESR